ncbi:MAG: glycosyltransferase [Candidatus Micrarchaeota archaeon]
MKIVVVGPIFPFRGGIAHSNRLLCEALLQNHDVTCVSFSRLYPRILFPGKSQKEAGLDESFQVPTEYILDSVNPLSWNATAKRIVEKKPDWVVFHWWHTGFAPCYRQLAQYVKKNSRAKISVLCHNFLPHDAAHGLHRFFAKPFFKYADCLAAFSSSVETELKKEFPKKPSGWFIEPSYDKAIARTKTISRSLARKKLGITDAHVLLFFGFIRHYKGLDFLLEAVAQSAKKRKVTLLVAGEFWEDKTRYEKKIGELGIEKNVRIFDDYIPSEQVPVFFAAADALVLPYVSSTNSAVLKMAFGFQTPVIATALAAHQDVIKDGQTGLLVKPKDSKSLANAIDLFFEKKMAEKMRNNMKKQKGLFDWTIAKEKILFNSGKSGNDL